jgi:hypothetical protein
MIAKKPARVPDAVQHERMTRGQIKSVTESALMVRR